MISPRKERETDHREDGKTRLKEDPGLICPILDNIATDRDEWRYRVDNFWAKFQQSDVH